ncbi:MAG: hypothetical protein E7335_10915 [Clostridiales bacterium]|nr:hypothetical protein [Clostridiales bacterium]
MYTKKSTLRFNAQSISKLNAIWFQIWSFPLICNERTQINTLIPKEDGLHFYPMDLGPYVFSAMTSNINPASYSISTKSISISLSLADSTLSMFAIDEEAEFLLEALKNHVKGIKHVDIIGEAKLGWEHYNVAHLLNSPHWVQILSEKMREENRKDFRWIGGKSNSACADELPAHVIPDFMLVGSGDNFICYDRENDRLAGGCKSKDIWKDHNNPC